MCSELDMTVIVHPCCGKTWASERVTWAEPPRGKKRSPMRTRCGEDGGAGGDGVWLIEDLLAGRSCLASLEKDSLRRR
jgi:hypothetical protein